jgi:hypothetical protein
MKALCFLLCLMSACSAETDRERQPIRDIDAFLEPVVDDPATPDMSTIYPDMAYNWGGGSPICNTCPKDPIPGGMGIK